MAEDLSDEQALEQAMAALRIVAGQPEPEASVQYAIFLGRHQLPYDDDVFSKPGFARNSLYNKLSEILRRGMFPGDDWMNNDPGGVRLRQYQALCRAIGFQRTAGLKKKLVDMALAEGLIRIEPIVKHAAQGQGLS